MKLGELGEFYGFTDLALEVARTGEADRAGTKLPGAPKAGEQWHMKMRENRARRSSTAGDLFLDQV